MSGKITDTTIILFLLKFLNLIQDLFHNAVYTIEKNQGKLKNQENLKKI